jgi:hypothetical protein
LNKITDAIRERVAHLALQYGHNYHDILDRLNETGDFQEANEADDKFTSELLSIRLNDKLELDPEGRYGIAIYDFKIRGIIDATTQ